MGQGSEKTETLMAEMAHDCTSCGECVRPCSFLQQQGTPAAIAGRGTSESNLLSAFGCSLCGLCDAVCPETLSPSALFLTMRQEAHARGLVDLKAYTPWLSYEKTGASFLFKRYVMPKGCSTVFFPGCSLPGVRPAAVHALFARLRQIDPACGLVLDCCGKISHDLGLSERFEDIFSRLAERLQQNGITRVLTSCPGCSKILRKYGSKFEVLSVYEVLASESKDQGQESRIKNVPLITPAVVTIHDPCTARFDDAQQQSIRKLITNTGHTIHEMTEHGRTTRCCGQGGMVEGCVPGTVTRESKQIAVGATGQLVVTSCGACCDTLSAVTPAIHITDLLTGTTDYPAKPASSAKRWLNRLKLRFSRLL